MSSTRHTWNSGTDLDIRNAILDALVDIDLKPKTDKPFINLSLGDPTKNPELQPSPATTEAVVRAVRSGKYNGYGPPDGLPQTKAALAEFYTSEDDGLVYSASDVIMANGASEALDMVVTVLCKPGSNILFPKPGFAYGACCNARRVEDRYYNLIPEREWECDFEHMKSLVDKDTAAIVITNPSNPCGSNFSREHLSAILDFAAAHFLPVISDEIYGELVFAGENFYPMANLNAERARSWTSSSPTSAGPVPLITIGGLAKRWLVPGWRIGWILLHDPEHLFKFDMARALRDVCTVALAPSSITQAAVPDILRDTQREWYATAIAVVERSARACADALSDVAGLTVVRPRGSLYMLVGVDASSFEGIVDEWDFVQKLVWEEAVFPVPGRCFRYEGFMRIVTATKLEDLKEACVRLKAFCDRHRKRT